MVTLAEGQATRYKVSTRSHILLKGFINGNWGEGNIEWLKVAAGDAQQSGEPIIRTTTVGGEDFSVDGTANTELGYGVTEWDPNQVADTDTEYAAGDLIPVLPFHMNTGMIFQGEVNDTDGDKGPDTVLDIGGVFFAIADYANRSYAALKYFVADTDATQQKLVLYALAGGFGG
jgi:hypothetical protein